VLQDVVTSIVIVACQPAPATPNRFPASNPFVIRTSTKRARNPFRIRTSRKRPDLRIPKDLQLPNFSRNPFVFCTYAAACNCGKQTTYNPSRIRTYEKLARNSFRIRTYKKPGGAGGRTRVRIEFALDSRNFAGTDIRARTAT
jgi:hypothetical protein